MGITISKISQNGSGLDIIWSDGEKSNFNFLWLRDNCPTAHDKDSRHRMFNILKVSQNISPKRCNVNPEGKLGLSKEYIDIFNNNVEKMTQKATMEQMKLF